MTLDQIQSRLKSLVESAASMEDRPVLIEDKNNLIAQVEQTLSTMSLAVVVALQSGENKSAVRGRIDWDETFEIVIHRGQLDGVDVPATLTVLEEIRKIVHDAPLDPAARLSRQFRCLRHDLRDSGDGAYARVLTVAINNPTP